MLQLGRDCECPSRVNWKASGWAPGPGSLEHTGSSWGLVLSLPCPRPHPGLRVGLGLCSKRAVHSSLCFQTFCCPPACWSFRVTQAWLDVRGETDDYEDSKDSPRDDRGD